MPISCSQHHLEFLSLSPVNDTAGIIPNPVSPYNNKSRSISRGPVTSSSLSLTKMQTNFTVQSVGERDVWARGKQLLLLVRTVSSYFPCGLKGRRWWSEFIIRCHIFNRCLCGKSRLLNSSREYTCTGWHKKNLAWKVLKLWNPSLKSSPVGEITQDKVSEKRNFRNVTNYLNSYRIMYSKRL